ncbi:MAG: hypothetical protein WBB50_06070, partial [Methyloceanibacter sp.]
GDDVNLGAGFDESVIGRGKLLEPKAGRLAGTAHEGSGRHHEHYLERDHDLTSAEGWIWTHPKAAAIYHNARASIATLSSISPPSS